MLAEHIAIHQPVTPPEKELVDQMAIARWRIRRFVAAETDLIDSEMARNREKVNKEFAPTDSGVHLAMAIRSLADESRCLSLMSRYEARHQRTQHRAQRVGGVELADAVAGLGQRGNGVGGEDGQRHPHQKGHGGDRDQ